MGRINRKCALEPGAAYIRVPYHNHGVRNAWCADDRWAIMSDSQLTQHGPKAGGDQITYPARHSKTGDRLRVPKQELSQQTFWTHSPDRSPRPGGLHHKSGSGTRIVYPTLTAVSRTPQ